MPIVLAEADYGQLIAIAVVLISSIIGSLANRGQQKKREQRRRQRSGPGRGAPEEQRRTAKVPMPTRPEPMPTRPEPMQQRTATPPTPPPAPRPTPRVAKPAPRPARPATVTAPPAEAATAPVAAAHRGMVSGRSLPPARSAGAQHKGGEVLGGEVLEPISPDVAVVCDLLSSRRGLRTAMIIKEVFDEPLSLRGPRQ